MFILLLCIQILSRQQKLNQIESNIVPVDEIDEDEAASTSVIDRSCDESKSESCPQITPIFDDGNDEYYDEVIEEVSDDE